MRFVQKRQQHSTQRLNEPETYQALKQICQSQQGNLASDRIYRQEYDGEDERLSLVIKHLNFSYFGKCAYCEREVSLEVDHYRPKSRYYWLCYEWTNLVPACHSCNNYKGIKFKIAGKRVNGPCWIGDELDLDKFKALNDPLIGEQPILLNPEIDDPKTFFQFKIGPNKVIRIEGVDDDNRGNDSIDICRLNRDEVLVSRRQDVLESLIEQLVSIYDQYGNSKNVDYSFTILKDKLIEVIVRGKDKTKDPKLTHTLFRQYVYQNSINFRAIVQANLPDKMRILTTFAAQKCLD